MFDAGAINQKIFAVHFDHKGGSIVQFGGYDQTKIVPNVALTYFNIPYKPYWSLTISAFRVGEKPKFENGALAAYRFEAKEAILDTFTPYIKLPRSLATSLYAKFFHENADLTQENDILTGSCDITKYQSINLFVNDRYFVKLMPESFVIDIGIRGKCFIPIAFNTEDSFIFGEPFFRNFYTIFDDTKSQIALAPSVNFVSSSVVEGVSPNEWLEHPNEYLRREA